MPYRFMLRFWSLTSECFLALSVYWSQRQVVPVDSRDDHGSVDGYHPVNARAAKAGNVCLQVGVEGMYERRVRAGDQCARKDVWRRRRSRGVFGVSIRIRVIGCRWTRRSGYVWGAVYGSLGGLRWRGAGMWLLRQLQYSALQQAPFTFWFAPCPMRDISSCDASHTEAHHRYNVPYQTIALIGANHPPPHTLPALLFFRPARACIPAPSCFDYGCCYSHLCRLPARRFIRLPCSSNWPSALALRLDVLHAGRGGIEERRGRMREGTAGVAKWCLYTGTHSSRYLRCRYQWR